MVETLVCLYVCMLLKQYGLVFSLHRKNNIILVHLSQSEYSMYKIGIVVCLGYVTKDQRKQLDPSHIFYIQELPHPSYIMKLLKFPEFPLLKECTLNLTIGFGNFYRMQFLKKLMGSLIMV